NFAAGPRTGRPRAAIAPGKIAPGFMSVPDYSSWPKAELHLHLDGSVRPRTVLELALQDGVPLPSSDLQLLRASLVAPDDCPSLVAYIGYFDLPIVVMQTADALKRVTRELFQDLGRDGVRYAKVR